MIIHLGLAYLAKQEMLDCVAKLPSMCAIINDYFICNIHKLPTLQSICIIKKIVIFL